MATSEAFCRTVASSILVFCNAPSAPSLDSVENPSVSLAVSSLSLMAALDCDAALLTSCATRVTSNDAFSASLTMGVISSTTVLNSCDVSSITLSICDASRSFSAVADATDVSSVTSPPTNAVDARCCRSSVIVDDARALIDDASVSCVSIESRAPSTSPN